MRSYIPRSFLALFEVILLFEINFNSGKGIANGMRIQLNTDHLEVIQASQASQDDRTRIEALLKNILPSSIELWSSALEVIKPMDNSGFLVDPDDCSEDIEIDIPYNDHSIGVYGTDLLIYVQLDCWSDSLGKGRICQFDHINRPTVGSVTICLDHMELNDDGEMEDKEVELYIGVVMHEISHVLGFTSGLMSKFLTNDGTPWGVTEKSVTCHDGDTRVEEVPNILREENGVWEIATPTVIQAVRNHFNCPSATGARLENQSSSSGCFNSHLDERYFFHDIMGPTIYFHNMLSPILLAIFEDSGWYEADYTYAQVPSFGHGAGCDFLTKDCIVNDGDVPDYGHGYFCNDVWPTDSSPPRHCDATHTSIASCNLLEDEEPSEEFQYFSNKDWGGSFSKSDYCPMIIWWKEYCNTDERCFESTNGGDPSCLEFDCSSDKQHVSFTIQDKTYLCEEDFDVIEGTELGDIECPRFASICPEFVCPKNCSGKGKCNWNTGTCDCYDSNDSTAGCWKSSPSSGVNVDDSDDSTKIVVPSANPSDAPSGESGKPNKKKKERRNKKKKKKGKL